MPCAKEYIEFEKNKKDLNNIIQDKKSDEEMIALAEKELKDAESNNEINEIVDNRRTGPYRISRS